MPLEPTSTVADVAMGEVLKRVASELTDAAGLAQALQVTLSPLLGSAGEVVAAAQDLDQLTQQIEGLTIFIAALGERCPGSWQVAAAEAAAGLPLHHQKIRLGSPATDDCQREPAGSFELF